MILIKRNITQIVLFNNKREQGAIHKRRMAPSRPFLCFLFLALKLAKKLYLIFGDLNLRGKITVSKRQFVHGGCEDDNQKGTANLWGSPASYYLSLFFK